MERRVYESHNFFVDCLQNFKKKMEKGFLKTQKVFFQKVEYIGMFFKKNLTNK